MLKHAFAPAVNGGGPCAYIYPEGSGELTSFVCNASLLADMHDLSSDLHAYQQGPEVGRCSICGGTREQHPTMETVPLPPCLVCSNCRNSLYDGLELFEIFTPDDGHGNSTVALVWCAPNGVQQAIRMYARKHGGHLRARRVSPAIFGETDLRDFEAATLKEQAIVGGIKTSEEALAKHRAMIKERWGV